MSTDFLNSIVSIPYADGPDTRFSANHYGFEYGTDE
jgi:hypothetical protein